MEQEMMMKGINDHKGLKISRYFTKEGVSPFEMFVYDRRSSIIKNPDGSTVFEMNDVEVPSFWTQVATDILAQKYFRKAGVPLHKENGEPLLDENGKVITGSETSIKQVAHRIAGCWRHWGERFHYFASPYDSQIFYEEMVYMLINQNAAPNSPQWFTTGLNWAYGITGPAQGHSYVDPLTRKLEYSKDAYTRSQPHACFIQNLKDDLVRDSGIFSLLTREARIFKYGSGTGSNFSNLRGKGEKLSGGGQSSGLMSFLKIFDVAAGSVKSGGTTRRAAKMVCLDLDHPEIENFIWWKVREEEKVADLVAGSKILKQKLSVLIEKAKNKTNPLADKEVQKMLKEAAASNIPLNYLVRAIDLAKQGYELPLQEFDTHYESEAYQTVSGQNSNNSIRIPNHFFTAVQNRAGWNLIGRNDGKVFKTIDAQKMWNDIGYCAWASADPGVQYDTTINEWHTCPAGGRINSSNPCVTGDTLVLTEEGRWKRIDSFVDTPITIITNTGIINECPIMGSFKTGKKPVYKLETKSGYEIKLTADHKVFTINRGFINACELTKNDHILIPHHPVAEISDLKVSKDKTFLQMIGIYLGDGCGGDINPNRGIQLTMNKESETPILEKFAEYTASNYERITYKNTPASVQITKTSTKYVITNQSLMARFKELVDLSVASHEKCLSQQIFELPLCEQKYVLQGLFTADGTIANYGEKSQYVALDSTSLQLIKDVQILLLGFGIKSKIYKNRRAGKETALLPDGAEGLKEYHVKEMHTLRISRSSRIAFEELIGFMEESTKNDRLKRMNENVSTYQDLPTDSIDSLEFIGLKDVYDLTEPLTDSFIANGITVHNCSEYMFLDDTACNLASINLVKLYDENKGFDVQGYRHTIRLWTIALEISVLMAQFPSEAIAQKSYEYRTLGLGFANVGTLLMLQGVPYDSDKGRAIAGYMAAIMTGDAYSTSAEMAKILGPFERYPENQESMLRVIRNHRRAAYNRPEHEYEQLTIKPMGINPNLCPVQLLEAAQDAWNNALEYGQRYGYRNAQTTVLAPTGTIGLVMDCDTTGVEPDYSLVKYKKLAGGGFFKIVNQSVPKALQRLGYSQQQCQEIISYCLGSGTLEGSPYINRQTLLSQGLNHEQLAAVEKELKNSMDINYVFNSWTLGEDFYNSVIKNNLPSKNNKRSLSFLEAFGFTAEEIKWANRHICGTMTLEGAPHLKQEHYAVFDCANKCGSEGQRYIHPYGHLKMLAATQPFISGAISKTINMPREWDIEQVKTAYYDAWKMMLKGVALYRDSCKLSQPLNSTLEDNPELKRILEEPLEEAKPRNKISNKVMIGPKELLIEGTVDKNNREKLQEISISFSGSSRSQDLLLTTIVNAINFGLKNDHHPSEIAENTLNTDGHPVIMELSKFLQQFKNGKNSHDKNKDLSCFKNEDPHSVLLEQPSDDDAEHLEKCRSCGASQMRQNGTCRLCEVCGETSGCS